MLNGIVFFDLKKVFDTIDHDIFLKILDRYYQTAVKTHLHGPPQLGTGRVKRKRAYEFTETTNKEVRVIKKWRPACC